MSYPGPKITVIVRTCDRPKYLKECLQSIALQTYKNIEVFVINDGGESIEKLISSFKSQLDIKLLELEYQHGRCRSANYGLTQSSGKYLCFLDDDDIFYPSHIEDAVTYLEDSEYKVVYFDSIVAEQVPYSGHYATVNYKLCYSEEYNYSKLLKTNYIPILCIVFDRDVLNGGALFDTNIEVLEDWDFWLQIAARHPFKHIKKVTSEYRARKDNTNTVGSFNHRWERARKYVYDKHLMA